MYNLTIVLRRRTTLAEMPRYVYGYGWVHLFFHLLLHFFFFFFFFKTGIELLHTRESTLGSLFEKLALFSMHGRF